jgi:hypothetical protein
MWRQDLITQDRESDKMENKHGTWVQISKFVDKLDFSQFQL